ncbi:MAG: hypothetical protein JW936_11445 [Sedimentisphaerales bacterium]|nr:hypothetical protein [Sedimentisphaerales bacterium]
MRKTRTSLTIITLLIFSTLLVYVYAAPARSSQPVDRRLVSEMNATNMNYHIDADGDAAVTVLFNDERQQRVWVTTVTNTFREQEVRNVYTIVGEIPAQDITVEMLMELLSNNASAAYGSYQALHLESTDEIAIFFGGKVSVQAPPELLEAITIHIAEIADTQEQRIFGIDKY